MSASVRIDTNINLGAMGTQRIRDESAAAILTQAQLSFIKQRDPNGQAWKPLSKATIANRRNGSKTILRDTGLLFNSLQAVNGEVGSPLKYAGVHNRGYRHIPKRQFLPNPNQFSPELESELFDIAAGAAYDHIAGKKSWFMNGLAHLRSLSRRLFSS